MWRTCNKLSEVTSTLTYRNEIVIIIIWIGQNICHVRIDVHEGKAPSVTSEAQTEI